MSVLGHINFIEPLRSKADEKPYQLKYEAPDGFPSTNIVSQEHTPTLDDIRGHEAEFSLAKNGFSIMRLDEQLSYGDYDDKDLVCKVYFKQVAEGLQELLKASRVQIFEHVLRRRHADFPVATGQPYKYNQPTNTAHVDVTPTWAKESAQHMNGLKGAPLPSENFQFVNVWKPLRGPIRDWPLAVCDSSSIELADLRESDIVFGDRVIENYLLQYNAGQRWHYLSNQMPNEAWVFLQADSEPKRLCGAPHSSFLHPNHANAHEPRESIEVRAIVYYNQL